MGDSSAGGSNINMTGPSDVILNSPKGDILERTGMAYRILNVMADSPASRCGLIPWFDFIIKAGSVQAVDLVSKDFGDFQEDKFKDIVKNHVDKPLALTIYNVKNKQVRQVAFTPKKWSGVGFTGLQVVYQSFTEAIRQVVHITDVQADSPAAAGGIQAHSDYLLGTVDGKPFFNGKALVSLVQRYKDKPLDLFVYSTVADTIRVVRVVPSHSWPNANGLLGCDIGIGTQHRLPGDVRDTIGVFRPTRVASRLISNQDSDLLDVSQKSSQRFFQVRNEDQKPRRVKHQVRTSLGYGEILGENESSVIALLDWKLPKSVSVVYFVQKENYDLLPTL